MSAPGFVDAGRVRRSFARVAPDYGKADFLAREIDRRMLERLDYVRVAPSRIVDLGCSRGATLAALRERYPQASALGVDFAGPMLPTAPASAAWRRWLPGVASARPAFIAADACKLPFRPASFGLVWSNLLLHWLDDPAPALAEAHRVLETGGLLMFSTLGPDTLRELRESFVDGYAHVQRTIDMHDLGDLLVASGFADPVMDMEIVTLTYDSLDALLAELRAAGSICAMNARRRGLTGRAVWDEVRRRYEDRRRDGRLPATFEVVYGHAWKAAAKTTADGRAIIRFADRR
jgi:malonyl-CoA O-methyltransferase